MLSLINRFSRYKQAYSIISREVFTGKVEGNLKTSYNEIGAIGEVSHSFSQEDVNIFGGLCGDNNPLHIDKSFAEKTPFKGTIVHGIFVSSLFSTIFGSQINGSIYVSQSLEFKRPVHVDAKVKARIEVLKIDERPKGKLLTCSTKILLENGDLAVNGEAKVLVPK